ncbi:PREDICTED: probable RNA polymerase II nuclear localization protein SLC7A6OS [Vollenhovia emeryi]|uniref:probable RNA polymerase II nuclear localization protein SLC7A6OS n=1 Tax=Vollenhovia emeryi TaxID=411798 RepID=UPI0005F54647|nr:PREDICTED: probable RNA polymerase II nuclear localization protein SLC7A6OS [Vollenhovia emeryi]
MAAILRVKRKNTNAPLDTLVIACKRPKTEVASDTPTVQTVAQFAGTLADPTEDVTKHMARILPKISTESHKSGVKRIADNDNPANISGKVPKWIDVDSVTERYKVTDCQHCVNSSNQEELEDKWMTLIDVEDSWSVSRLAENQASAEDLADFVYDLYYVQQTGDTSWLDSENILVRADGRNVYVEDDDDDSSDSNAESHWKNDYPDTDPDRVSNHEDSDDYFDVYDDDDNLYDSKTDKDKYRSLYKLEMRSSSDSDSSCGKDDLLHEGASSNSEAKLTDSEETSDNEEMEKT